MDVVRATELQAALRAAAVLALPEGGFALSCGFGAAKVPTLERIDFLHGKGFFHPADEHWIPNDFSGSSAPDTTRHSGSSLLCPVTTC